jgi:hypothetical protein
MKSHLPDTEQQVQTDAEKEKNSSKEKKNKSKNCKSGDGKMYLVYITFWIGLFSMWSFSYYLDYLNKNTDMKNKLIIERLEQQNRLQFKKDMRELADKTINLKEELSIH